MRRTRFLPCFLQTTLHRRPITHLPKRQTTTEARRDGWIRDRAHRVHRKDDNEPEAQDPQLRGNEETSNASLFFFLQQLKRRDQASPLRPAMLPVASNWRSEGHRATDSLVMTARNCAGEHEHVVEIFPGDSTKHLRWTLHQSQGLQTDTYYRLLTARSERHDVAGGATLAFLFSILTASADLQQHPFYLHFPSAHCTSSSATARGKGGGRLGFIFLERTSFRAVDGGS